MAKHPMQIDADFVIRSIKQCLEAGASSRKSAMHTPVVGTADGDMRVMVLREFDPGTHTLRFHTDVRSPKVGAIESKPDMHVLAYDPEAKIQIRMRGRGRVERDTPAADAAWDASTNFAKRCYLAESGPSSDSAEPTSGLPQWVEGKNPDDSQVAPARENFAIVLVKVTEFDWLYLANSGHRRAKVTVSDDGQPSASWLVP